MSISLCHCSDPIAEDYDEAHDRRNKGEHEHSDIDNGAGGFVSDGAEDTGGRQLAPLSHRHSQSNNEVMQSSVFPQSNRRGSTTGGGFGAGNNALVAHPFNNNSNGNGNSHPPHSNGNELVLSRRPSAVLSEILSTRRPSALMAALTRPHQQYRSHQRQNMMEIREGQVLGSSTRTINMGGGHNGPECPEAKDFKRRNRRIGE